MWSSYPHQTMKTAWSLSERAKKQKGEEIENRKETQERKEEET